MKYESKITAEWAREHSELDELEAVNCFLADIDEMIRKIAPVSKSVRFAWGEYLTSPQKRECQENLTERGFTLLNGGDACMVSW